MPELVQLAPPLLIVALLAAVTWAGRRGYRVGADVIVRCLAGHLFSGEVPRRAGAVTRSAAPFRTIARPGRAAAA